MRPRVSSTLSAPISVSSRVSGASPRSAAFGDLSQSIAAAGLTKDFTRAAHHPSQAQQLGRFFAIQYAFALPTRESALRDTKSLSKLRLRYINSAKHGLYRRRRNALADHSNPVQRRIGLNAQYTLSTEHTLYGLKRLFGNCATSHGSAPSLPIGINGKHFWQGRARLSPGRLSRGRSTCNEPARSGFPAKGTAFARHDTRKSPHRARAHRLVDAFSVIEPARYLTPPWARPIRRLTPG